MDVEDLFDERADDGGVVNGVDEVRGEAGEAGEEVDAAKGVVRERAGLAFEVMREELGFIGGHVDGDRTLAFACLAGKTEVEGLFDLLVFPLVRENFALHQLPEEMGAAAGGVELLAGGHEAGTHGTGVCFAAGADANAT